jgi:uncharacterized membrane protein
VFAANVVISVMQAWTDSAVLTILLAVLSAFVSLVIGLGLIRAALVILDGRHPEVGDLISTKDIGPYLIATILVSLTVGVGLLLCIIPGLIAGFLLQFYGYSILDRRSDDLSVSAQPDPVGALRTSYEVVTRNLGDLLALAIVCFVMNVLGAIACGIGLLVSLPITAIALAYAWRHLTGGVIAPQQ